MSLSHFEGGKTESSLVFTVRILDPTVNLENHFWRWHSDKATQLIFNSGISEQNSENISLAPSLEVLFHFDCVLDEFDVLCVQKAHKFQFEVRFIECPYIRILLSFALINAHPDL